MFTRKCFCGLCAAAERVINTTVIPALMCQSGFRKSLDLVGMQGCYSHMVVLQVSQHDPPSQYLHAQQTASGQLHPASGQQSLASGQLQSAPMQLQAGQAHQHAAPGHLQTAPGQLEIVRPHTRPLSQLGSYIDLTSPTQSMSHSQPHPHSQSQPGLQVLSPCLGELFCEQIC